MMILIYSKYGKRLSSHVWIANTSGFNYCTDFITLKQRNKRLDKVLLNINIFSYFRFKFRFQRRSGSILCYIIHSFWSHLSLFPKSEEVLKIFCENNKHQIFIVNLPIINCMGSSNNITKSSLPIIRVIFWVSMSWPQSFKS